MLVSWDIGSDDKHVPQRRWKLLNFLAAPADKHLLHDTLASGLAQASLVKCLHEQRADVLQLQVLPVVIHVPYIESGFYYVMGNVNRPGTYGIGSEPVTLTRAIAAAGSIGTLAEPAKVDLVRRIGPDRQEIVQLDLAKIFAGLQPDYYIKKDDIINIGTSPISPWMAVLRNGFRATYGFGFVYDRNYADRDVGDPFQWPNLGFW